MKSTVARYYAERYRKQKLEAAQRTEWKARVEVRKEMEFKEEMEEDEDEILQGFLSGDFVRDTESNKLQDPATPVERWKRTGSGDRSCTSEDSLVINWDGKDSSDEDSATVKCDSNEDSATVKCDSNEDSGTLKCDSNKDSGTVKCDSNKDSGTVKCESNEDSGTVKCDSNKDSGTVKCDSTEIDGRDEAERRKSENVKIETRCQPPWFRNNSSWAVLTAAKHSPPNRRRGIRYLPCIDISWNNKSAKVVKPETQRQNATRHEWNALVKNYTNLESVKPRDKNSGPIFGVITNDKSVKCEDYETGWIFHVPTSDKSTKCDNNETVDINSGQIVHVPKNNKSVKCDDYKMPDVNSGQVFKLPMNDKSAEHEHDKTSDTNSGQVFKLPTNDKSAKDKTKDVNSERIGQLATNNNSAKDKTKDIYVERIRQLTTNNNSAKDKTKDVNAERICQLPTNNNSAKDKTKDINAGQIVQLATNDGSAKCDDDKTPDVNAGRTLTLLYIIVVTMIQSMSAMRSMERIRNERRAFIQRWCDLSTKRNRLLRSDDNSNKKTCDKVQMSSLFWRPALRMYCLKKYRRVLDKSLETMTGFNCASVRRPRSAPLGGPRMCELCVAVDRSEDEARPALETQAIIEPIEAALRAGPVIGQCEGDDQADRSTADEQKESMLTTRKMSDQQRQSGKLRETFDHLGEMDAGEDDIQPQPKESFEEEDISFVYKTKADLRCMPEDGRSKKKSSIWQRMWKGLKRCSWGRRGDGGRK